VPAPGGRQLQPDAARSALLDAGLLAEVYIRITRGQHSLVIDAGVPTAAQTASQAIDSAIFDLIAVEADDAEAAPYAAMLVELEKACDGMPVWRVAIEVAMA